MDWLVPDPTSIREALRPDVPLLESILRTSFIYLVLYISLRTVLKREAAGLGIADLLVVVLLADAVQNGLGKDYTSVTNAVVMALTLIFWNFALDYLSYRSRAFDRLIKPRPLPIIRNGKLNADACRRELLTREEIMGELRLQGIESMADVKMAFMEPSGKISVIRREE